MSSSLLDLALGVAPDPAHGHGHDSDARRVSLSASARMSLGSAAEAGEGRGGRDSLLSFGDGGGRVSDVGNGAGTGAAPVSMLEALRARTDDERPMVRPVVPAPITSVHIRVRTASRCRPWYLHHTPSDRVVCSASIHCI